MKRFMVNLGSIDAVREMCMKMYNADFKVTLESGAYRVDGASILGVFSLDLSKPVSVIVEDKHAKEAVELYSNYILEDM